MNSNENPLVHDQQQDAAVSEAGTVESVTLPVGDEVLCMASRAEMEITAPVNTNASPPGYNERQVAAAAASGIVLASASPLGITPVDETNSAVCLSTSSAPWSLESGNEPTSAPHDTINISGDIISTGIHSIPAPVAGRYTCIATLHCLNHVTLQCGISFHGTCSVLT
jgi:hypothetical protein